MLAALAKAASQSPVQSPGQQALMAAANLAKPPGAPPLPKPVDPADPAGDALAQQDAEIQQQKLELEKQKQEAMHRKEVAEKDKEIASLRQDLQGANMEAQRMRNQMEMLKQRQADADKLRAESEKLNSRRDQMAGEEAQHKARMSEAVAEAKATIAEERAKSTEQAANSNAQAYVKMTEDARKRSDEMFAGARDEVMKQREDVLKQKESILADKSKAFDERMNAANERNKTSPYLMKSLQDAASAARNIAKLRDRSLNSMDNVFLSDMPKTASQQANPQQAPQANPSQPAAAVQQQQAPAPTNVRVYNPGDGRSFEQSEYSKDVMARRKASLEQMYNNGDQSAAGHMQNAANYRNMAYQYRTAGSEYSRDGDGRIIAPGKSYGNGGYGSLYAGAMDELANEYERKGMDRADALASSADRNAAGDIELARYKDMMRTTDGVFHGRDRSMYDRLSNEASDAVKGKSDFSWWSIFDPTTYFDDAWRNYKVSKDMERSYGDTEEGRAAFRDAARAAGVSTTGAGRAFNLGLGVLGSVADAALTASMLVPGVNLATGGLKAGMTAAKAAQGLGKLQKLRKAYKAYRGFNEASRAANYAGRGRFVAGLNRANDAIGGWKGMAGSAALTGGVALAQNRYDQNGLQQHMQKTASGTAGQIASAALDSTVGSVTYPNGLVGAPTSIYGIAAHMYNNYGSQPSGSALPPAQPGDNQEPQAPGTQRGTTDTAGWINGGYNFNNLNNAASSTFVNYGPVAAARMVGGILGNFLPIDMNLVAKGSPYRQEQEYRRGMMNNAITSAAMDVNGSAFYRNMRRNDATSSRMQDDLKAARDDAAERYYGYKRNDSIWSI